MRQFFGTYSPYVRIRIEVNSTPFFMVNWAIIVSPRIEYMSIRWYWTKILKHASIPTIASSTTLSPFSEACHRLASKPTIPARAAMTIPFMLSRGTVRASSPSTTCVQKSVIVRITM